MKLLAGVAVLVLLIAACGGGGDSELSAEEQELADAIAAQMIDDSDTFTSQEDAECYAEGVVSDMGVDGLAAAGLDEAAVESGTGPSDLELTEDEVDSLLEPMMECVDFAAVFAAGLIEGADGEVSDESAECIANGISDDSIEAAARAGLEGEELDDETNQEFLSEVLDLMNECLTPEELQAVAGG